MELTDDQRAELGRIAARQYERDIPALSTKGRPAIEARKRKRDRLRQLREAWDALDPDTQSDVIAHVIREWEEYDPEEPGRDQRRLANPMPDVGRVAHVLERALSRPEKRPEDHPGFTDALKFLWSIWCPQQLGGDVVVADAVIPIAAAIAPLFGLSDADAQRRVRDRLYTLSETGQIERRPNSMKGRSPRPFV